MEAVCYEIDDLTCVMCQDVYTSPRFMISCYHSFCKKCIDGVAKATGSSVIACPICRIKTTLPKNGAAGLQSDFHYREEKLAEARILLNKKCVKHDKDVDRVCLQCECVLCEDCIYHSKGHDVHEYSQLLNRVEEQIRQMEGILTLKKNEAVALQARRSNLSNQLRHQGDLLHSRVDRQLKVVDSRLWSITQKGSNKLTKQIIYLQEEKKKSHDLLHRCKKQWKKGAKVSDILDSVKKVVLRLDKDVDVLSSVTTDPMPHPGLICDTKDMKHAFRDFFGQPVQYPPPEEDQPPAFSSKDAIIPVKIGRDKKVREILGVAPSTDQTRVMICFRGNPCYLFSSVAVIQIEDWTTVGVDHDVFQGKVVCYFDRLGKSKCSPALLKLSHDVGVIQISKGTPKMCLYRDEAGITQLHYLVVKLKLKEQAVGRKVPLIQPVTGSLVMPVDVVDPFNMDVSLDGKYCVIIDNGKDSVQTSLLPKEKKKKRKLKDRREETEDVKFEESLSEGSLKYIKQPTHGAVVKLFRKGKSEPVDIYRPTKSSFVPSDVCFCHWEKRQLLMADWQNDEIHVVHVGKKGFSFKSNVVEYLSELVKPTALNTDADCWVYVGCSNGSLLSWSMKGETQDTDNSKDTET